MLLPPPSIHSCSHCPPSQLGSTALQLAGANDGSQALGMVQALLKADITQLELLQNGVRRCEWGVNGWISEESGIRLN